ncbi:MAG: choice-of-anchor Q domain-containing protein [Caldilineaceae bacterium]
MNIVANIVTKLSRIPWLFRLVVLLLLFTFLSVMTARSADLPAPAAQGGCDFTATDEASLQQAIACVNSAGPGAHTIQIMANIALSQPTQQIVNPQASQIVIEGNGYTIDAQGNGRLFSIYLTEVAIHHLTLRGGRSLSDDWLAAGGAILLQGSHGDGVCGLTVRDSTLTDNQSSAGGAIANLCDSSTITITNSILSYNRATRGGAIFIPTAEELVSALIIDQSRLTDNQAQEQGGAILLRAGDAGTDATISNSTIANNRVISGTGGGLSIVTTSEPAITEVLLRNVALVNNSASGGGGLQVFSRGATIVTVANSTISYNRAESQRGGGIQIQGALEFDTTDVKLINSTVASNTAPSTGGIAKLDGLITLSNTLVAGNSNGDCQWDASAGLPNRVVSGGNNLDSDGSCLPDGVRQTSDIPTGNANLGPLDDNGGPTVSQLLLTGSQAIDAGNDAVCAAAPINAVDQRGVARPQGMHCDIGAYERPDAVACAYPVLAANDEATLRQAVDCLNVAPSGAYTLNITADIAYSQPMFRLHNGVLTSVLVAGNGHTLDAQGHGRVLTLEDVQALTLRDLTLTGGKVVAPDPFSISSGGGIAFDCDRDVLCNWTLVNTIVRNNQADVGGGIDYSCNAGGGGALVVQDSVLRDNQATSSGGGLFYSTDEDSLACSVTLRNTLVEGNQAEDGGGLRIVRPRVTISDSTIRNNRATQWGGGLMARVSDGFIDMTVLRSTFSGNQAGMSGGGVYIASPYQRFDIKFINSTFSGNRVENGGGGGLYLQETEGTLRIALINSTVTQNEASQGAGVQIFDRAAASAFYTSTLRLTNSLIANNQGSDCAGAAEPGIDFTGQRVLSFGHNLDSDGTCLTPEVRQTGDIPNGNANLGPLADNGGPTLTHALFPRSVAIDAGDDAVCADLLVNGVDQRGVPRFQGAHCDSGAYEALPLAPANTLRIQALIDGRSQLIVRGNTAQWHHFDWAAPGRHEFVKRPTVINDTLWFPVWPDQPDAENRDCNCTSDLFTAAGPLLPTDGTAIGLSLIRSRGSVQIVQFPDAGNDYTLIVEFDDSESGSDTYSIDLTWGRTALFVSSSSSGRAGAVQFRDEDIVAYDGTTNTWQMIFDGSDLGVTKDVDAFVFLADGSLLLSFNAPTDVPGLGKVDDSDIVQFTPTQLGSTTAGSFTLYLRGADVGLTTDGEDIDAIGFTADGKLVVSTIGDFAVTNLTGQDEDLIRLDDKTASVWSFLLDGSTVGLANEDVNGLWIDPVTGELYLTVKDSFAFGEGQATVPIDADDIFVCTPMGSGVITSCAYRLFWDSDGHDYGSENLNAIGLGVLPPSFVAAVQASSDESPTPEELAPDDDIDDLNLEESIHQLYLPLIEQ